MSKLYQLPESEKNRIRNLHLEESKYKKISSVLNEGDEKVLTEQANLNAGNYHMWSNCNGGQTYALYHNSLSTATGDPCHNASNQQNPGLVLACTQALVSAWGTGPVLSWMAGDVMSCWEYQGTQFHNNIPNAASPTQGAGYSTPTVLSNCSQCGGTGGDMAWMCTDVAVDGGTGCQQMVCPYGNIATAPQWWNVFGGCWTNQIDCDNNAGNGGGPCNGYSGPEHECINGQCVPTQGGQYPDLTTCQTNCGGTTDCVNCTLGQMSQVQAGTQCPQGYSPIQNIQQGQCTECQQGICTNVGWNYAQGFFNSMSECQNATGQQACQPPMNDYECVNGGCVVQQGGTYTGPTAQADCNAVCGQYPNYKCTGGAQGCIQNPNGQYGGATGLADCETACCQNSLANWNWNSSNGGYQNATCQQLTAKFNTPALTAIGDCAGNLTGNVPYNFNHKCRYDWMVTKAAQLGCPCSGGVNTACCSDPGFAVGFATSDPLGCFNSTLQTNSQNANTNGFGCPWFCNVLANKHNSLAGTQSPVAQCKHSGGIAFLTDYMTTAQSNFITGAASFTGPCPNIPNGPGQNNIC